MELVHGGDWAGYRARFGMMRWTFSANVSPLGLPQGVADAIVAALPTADRYPEPPLPGAAHGTQPGGTAAGTVDFVRQWGCGSDLPAGVGAQAPAAPCCPPPPLPSMPPHWKALAAK